MKFIRMAMTARQDAVDEDMPSNLIEEEKEDSWF